MDFGMNITYNEKIKFYCDTFICITQFICSSLTTIDLFILCSNLNVTLTDFNIIEA